MRGFLDEFLDYCNDNIRVGALFLIVVSPFAFVIFASGYLYQCLKTLITGRI